MSDENLTEKIRGSCLSNSFDFETVMKKVSELKKVRGAWYAPGWLWICKYERMKDVYDGVVFSSAAPQGEFGSFTKKQLQSVLATEIIPLIPNREKGLPATFISGRQVTLDSSSAEVMEEPDLSIPVVIYWDADCLLREAKSKGASMEDSGTGFFKQFYRKRNEEWETCFAFSVWKTDASWLPTGKLALPDFVQEISQIEGAVGLLSDVYANVFANALDDGATHGYEEGSSIIFFRQKQGAWESRRFEKVWTADWSWTSSPPPDEFLISIEE